MFFGAFARAAGAIRDYNLSNVTMCLASDLSNPFAVAKGGVLLSFVDFYQTSFGAPAKRLDLRRFHFLLTVVLQVVVVAVGFLLPLSWH